MRKWIIGSISVFVLAVGGFVAREIILQQRTTDYYVQITTDGEKIEGKNSAGNTVISYRYKLTAYDKNGQKKEIAFNAYKNRSLRKNAYLKITWNKEKGVTSYEEVNYNILPNKVKNKIKTVY